MNMDAYKSTEETHKKILRVTVDMEINLPKDKTIEDIKSGLILYPDDAVDGFVISSNIRGYDNTKDFFLKEAHFSEIKVIPENRRKKTRNYIMNTAQAINGELRPDDWVIVIPSDVYGCLVGMVTEITPLDSPKYDTEAVHVDFMETDYSDKRKDETVEQMIELYREKRSFDDLPLDNVIMLPDSLIRITGIELCTLKKLLDSYETAEDFCNQILNGEGDIIGYV